MTHDYYDILNIPKDANRMTIREAYMRLKNAYSGSDGALYSLGSEDDAKHQVSLIEEAFRILNDDYGKAQYDGKIKPQTATMAGHINTVRSTLKVMRTRAAKADPAKYEPILASLPLGDGATLKALREAACVSEEEILDRTKISIEYFRAIEANQFEKLPQIVYVRGFIRSYLRYLDVPDADKIIAEYAKRFDVWLAGKK